MFSRIARCIILHFVNRLVKMIVVFIWIIYKKSNALILIIKMKMMKLRIKKVIKIIQYNFINLLFVKQSKIEMWKL